MKREGDIFGKYGSKVKRVNIPIPSFEYVHKSWFSDHLGSPTAGFMIGRDRIIEKLKTWLIKEKTSGGSYLITGYRGMGKTSFVDRVLYELVGEPGIWRNIFGLIIFAIPWCVSAFAAPSSPSAQLISSFIIPVLNGMRVILI